MSKTDLVCCLLGQLAFKLSHAEKLLLEINLFTRLCNELSEIFTSQHKEYWKLINSYFNRKENMGHVKLIQEIIKDILSTKEYSLSGISHHTHIPEEVLYEIAVGINTNPTFELSRKIFELHIDLRRNLYDEIMRKFTSEHLSSV